MSKYISIPTTVTGVPFLTFNTENITSTIVTGTTTFVIYAYTKSYTFTTSTAGSASTVTLINNAIAAVNGPVLIPIVLSTGVSIAALPVVA